MRGQPFVYQQMPTAEQQQSSILDPTRLEVFRKNWEYYKMWNPQVSKMALTHLGRRHRPNASLKPNITILSYLLLGKRKSPT